MEDKKIIAATNGFIVNDQEEILLVREKNSDLWLALSGIIKSGHNPKEVLENKAKKELNLQVESAHLFDSDFIDNILMLRFLVTNYSGEIKLGDKYEEFSWVKLSEVIKQENVCPYVKKAVLKLLEVKELDSFENKYKLETIHMEPLLRKGYVIKIDNSGNRTSGSFSSYYNIDDLENAYIGRIDQIEIRVKR